MFETGALDSVAGAYVDEDIPTTTAGTRLEADDRNIVQQEIVNAIEGTGQTLDAAGVFTNNDQLLKAILSSITSGSISGLIASNDTDADHDIEISIGSAKDSTNAEKLELTSPMTKKIDNPDGGGAWESGDDKNGLFTGSVAIDTEYHRFLIKKDSDGSIDWGWDTSAIAANRPGGYAAYRRIGSDYTDGFANILPFDAIEVGGGAVEVNWDAFIGDLVGTLSGITRTLYTLTAPANSIVSFLIKYSSGSPWNSWIKPSSFTDILPAAGVEDANQNSLLVDKDVRVDGSRQIAHRVTLTQNITITTYKYIDERRS